MATLGAFLSKQAPFQKETCVQNNQTGSHKSCLSCKMAENLPSISLNPYLAFRDNSRAGGVCQLKSPSYLQYTTCNHSEQVFSYRSEPTFIQTRHFSLDSQVLDFTHTKNDREYQISSCH